MTWEKSEQLKAVGHARPLRVAYLVDLEACPDSLFDAIFAEAYSRWGGRRSLIVPASSEGIDPRYEEWLFFYDADVIYSFVGLSDAAVETCHERYGPAHLVRHRAFQREAGGPPSYRIDLPTNGLSSLSVLPFYASRNWGFDGPPRNVQLLTKFEEQAPYPFLRENFGFVASSFPNGLVGRSFPDLFTCMTLISEQALANKHWGKDPRATHVTSEDTVLDALASRNGPLTVAQLSDFLSPYLRIGGEFGRDGTCIVVGDTALDRLLFWNLHHHFDQHRFSEMTTLRLPLVQIADDTFLARVRKLLQQRGARGHNGHNDHVTLHSCSVDEAELKKLADRLRQGALHFGVSVRRHADPAEIVPDSFDPDRVHWWRGGGMAAEPTVGATAEFHSRRISVPLAMPWYMKEMPPPAGLRGGSWMVDLAIDRLLDHCRFVNLRHAWLLPRRLRLERVFAVEREAVRDEAYESRVMRVMRGGQLSVPLSGVVTRVTLTAPEDDLAAIRAGVCNDREWLPFDRKRKDAPHGRMRFAFAELSDKGRYLIGTLGLFDNLHEAFDVLMSRYWRSVLQDLGGVPEEKEVGPRDRLIQTLRKRVGQASGPLTFASDDQLDRLAREAMRAGRMIGRERRHVTYGELHERWTALCDAYFAKHPAGAKSDAEDYYRDHRWLDQSIQLLCQREVLFQGREWRCRSCYNRNWVSIDELGRTLICGICGREEAAPVAGHWQFRGNPFLLEAFRDHGTEAAVYALWRLADRARQSFYFAPSLKLWCDRPKDDSTPCDVEVDAIAVVDGHVCLVEAKSGGGFSEVEIHQLVMAAERIRPDLVLLAGGEDSRAALERAADRLRPQLPPRIQTEITALHANDLESSPLLPG
jgi:hypothetical protein